MQSFARKNEGAAPMKTAAFFQSGFALAIITALSTISAQSQVKMDASAESVRRLAKQTYLEDLAVNDTALTFANMCADNGALYLPGWTVPADLAASTYAQTGLILRIQVLPGRKVKGILVDAAQAQAIAKGKTNEPPSLDPAAYKLAVINYVNGLYNGSFFGPQSCEEERRLNPLRTLTLYSLESINGFTKVSDLLASVSKR
jgi:hypothetical protein